MSRYGFNPEKDIEIVVGWDNPLQTYFGQVYATGADLPKLDTMLDLGCFNVTCINELSKLIGHDIPGNIFNKLRSDRERASEPTALQRIMAEALKK